METRKGLHLLEHIVDLVLNMPSTLRSTQSLHVNFVYYQGLGWELQGLLEILIALWALSGHFFPVQINLVFQHDCVQ